MVPIKSPCAALAAQVAAGAVQPCRGPWVLIATILASSMAFIDGTVVNVALPALHNRLRNLLGEGIDELKQWAR